MHSTPHPPCNGMRQRRVLSLGFTVIECLVVLALVASLARMAAPSIERMVDTRRLLGASGQIHAALQQARSQALARAETVAFSLVPNPAGSSCQVVHTGSLRGCQCTAHGRIDCPPALTGTYQVLHLLNVQQPVMVDAPGLAFNRPSRLSLSATASSIRFDPRAGTATPAGRVVLSTSDARDVQHIVSLTGRVRRCSNSAAWPHVPRCTS